MNRVVIVGYGMAGARLAGELLARDRDLDLTVLGAEPHRAYNRILLSNLLAGKVAEGDTLLPDAHGKRLSLRLGAPAVSLDRPRREVSTSDGAVFGYDALVLATGSTAIVPPIDGLADPLVFRTLDDCRRIAARLPGARSALVLGGGLLGLEAARGLAARGLAVTVVHAVGHLMERQLDPGASAILDRTLRDLGIEVHLDALAVGALPGGGGLRLSDGRVLTADLVVVACGVRPEVSLAQDAALTVKRGILVDDRLCTSDPDIYAIGDCAEYPGEVSGLVAPAWAQAHVLADLVTGTDPGARYRPVPPVTRLKAAGIDLAAMGESTVDSDDAVTFVDPARRRYAKLVIRDGRLAGAIMLGDHPAVGAVIQHFDRQTPLPSDPRSLLFARPGAGSDGALATSPALMPDTALVCRCNGISKGALMKTWLGGARDLEAATKAGTGCGSCRDVVEGIASWLSTVEVAV
jgi:assimilatory nitrate reductase electron transfer subunit